MREALSIYSLLASRFVRDFHLAPLVFDVLGIQVSRAQARELLEMLVLIHETWQPVRGREVEWGGDA